MSLTDQTHSPDQIAVNADRVVLVAEKITKRYPGTVALDQVDFTVYAGSVNVLIGENGAGKSTLMKILAGVERATSGRLLLDGSPVEFKSTREAAQAGIGIIFQELNLYPNLSISENIFVARELTRGGVVQHRAQEQVTSELLNRLEQPLNPATLVRELRRLLGPEVKIRVDANEGYASVHEAIGFCVIELDGARVGEFREPRAIFVELCQIRFGGNGHSDHFAAFLRGPDGIYFHAPARLL